MKTETSNLVKLVATIFAATALTVSFAQADVAKGQKLYQKKYKKQCGVSGAKMAGSHTQDEWEEMKEEGTLLEYLNGKCNGKVQEKHVDDLYDFFYEYGSDSGNVPSC
ncbi:MAG: cytochrome C [Sulfurimonadaceae bacterium]|nr:cytochrome C [Sulfurimonadaceae bacterium]